MQVVHGHDPGLRAAALEEYGEIAADKTRAAGDQNAIGKSGHGLTGRAGLMNFFEPGAMGMLAGRAFDTFRPGPSGRAGHNRCIHINWNRQLRRERASGASGFLRRGDSILFRRSRRRVWFEIAGRDRFSIQLVLEQV